MPLACCLIIQGWQNNYTRTCLPKAGVISSHIESKRIEDCSCLTVLGTKRGPIIKRTLQIFSKFAKVKRLI